MSEVIDTSEFQFKGKHAEYVFKLTSEIDTRTKFRIFQRNIDLLLLLENCMEKEAKLITIHR